MSAAPVQYRFTLDDFVLAWEAGAFSTRVELIEGEVWPVSIGPWHGDTTMRVARALPNQRFEVSQQSLASGGSLPDPDCWVRPRTATPGGRLSRRMVTWDAADVLLVVEVGDESENVDLGVKANVYSRAGYTCYWVVTPEAIYEHTGPTEFGYHQRTTYRRGQRVPVRYAGTDLAVDDLLGTD